VAADGSIDGYTHIAGEADLYSCDPRVAERQERDDNGRGRRRFPSIVVVSRQPATARANGVAVAASAIGDRRPCR
jgi:hypothetical protein